MVQGGNGSNGLKSWGRRAYIDKEGREILNDVTRSIAREEPDHVDDPTSPSLSEILKHRFDFDESARTLSELVSEGLSYQEAFFWYWFRYSQFDIMDIYCGHMVDSNVVEDDDHRRNMLRNIRSTLMAAAEKLPEYDPEDVDDMNESRSRHDRPDIKP